jgi:uncharacterized protein YecE (DUF72 family)
MDFGKVTADGLEEINFALPPDKRETATLLSNQAKGNPRIFVGCAKWGRKDWIGKIYPKGTKEADFLSHYAKFFDTIELNATFYKLPTKSQTTAWKNKVGADFKFCPKVSEKISHTLKLKDAQALTDRFLEGISGFGKNLGPVFLMPHPSMGPKATDTIAQFVESVSKEIELFVELRHAHWFKDPEVFQQTFDIFESAKAGSVITDAAGRRDCVHMRLTTPNAFIRFVGNGLHASDYSRVDEWVDRIKSWMDQGIEKVYFFMHQHDEIHSPELAKYVIQRINKVCGLALREPTFIS